MNENTITRLQSRADTKAKWEEINPILLENEIGYEKDTGRYKMGDNKKTQWNDLPYYIDAGNGNGEKSVILNDDVNNFSELKVFFIKSIDMINKKIYLCKEHIDKPEISTNDYTDNTFITPEYAKGDIFDLIVSATVYNKGRSHVHFVSKIVSINNNVIGYDNELPFTDLLNDTAAYSHSFFVSSKPNKGIYDIGGYSVAEGAYSIAAGKWSHAEGYGNIAAGRFAHVEGRENKASYAAHAEGQGTIAEGLISHTEGYLTQTKGAQAHAEGRETIAKKDYSHAEGYNTHANELASHSEGNLTEANGKYSHSEGYDTTAVDETSHAEGYQTYSAGQASHTEGIKTRTDSKGAHAEGGETYASGEYSHVEGYKTLAQSQASHAEGKETIASGEASHAEGYGTGASGIYSHAEGYSTISEGSNAHAEGRQTKAKGQYGSHAEGFSAQAIGDASHAENRSTQAHGFASHAEGKSTYAYGEASHTEGVSTQTSTKAIGAHAEGEGTYANTVNQHVQGKYNISDTEDKYAHIVGNGTNNKRSNAHTLDWKGNAWFAGDVTIGESKDKLVTEIDFYNLKNSVNNEIRAISSLKYYGDIDIQPSGHDFNYGITNEENKTAKVTWNGEANLNYPATVILPYEYYIDDIGYNIEEIEIVDSNEENINWTFPNNILTIKFSNITASSKIIIPEGVIRIEINSSTIEGIQIPKSVIGLKITDTTLNNIYYQGNKYDWQEYIIKRPENIIPAITNIYFNSQNSSVAQITNELSEQEKALECLQYYGDSNLQPSDNELFTFILNNNDMTAAIASNKKTIYDFELVLTGEITIPYKYEKDGKVYKVNKIANQGFQNGTMITKINLPNTIEVIGQEGFDNCLSLTEFYLPDGVKIIEDNAFHYCSSLNKIIIPNSIKQIGQNVLTNIYYNGTFEEWNKISIDKNNFEFSQIFYNYNNITDIIINEQISSFKRFENYDNSNIYPSDINLFTFSIDDTTMEAIIYFNGEKDEEVGEFVENKEIVIPYEYIFNEKTYKVTKIGEGAFYKACYIPSIIIPNSVYSIDDSAFGDCFALENIKLPNQLKTLQSYVFSWTPIKTLTISNTLKNIEPYVFTTYNTQNLTEIYFQGSEAQWKKIEIDETNNEKLQQVTIYFTTTNIATKNLDDIYNKYNELKEEINNSINNQYYYNNKNVIINSGCDFEDWDMDGVNENLNIYSLTNSNTLWLPTLKIPDTITSISSQGNEEVTTIIIPRDNFATLDLDDNIKNQFKNAFINLKTLFYINPWGEMIRYSFN